MEYREQHLAPLFQALDKLPYAGGRRASLFKRLLGPRAIDALLHLPSQLITYTPIQHIYQSTPQERIAIRAQVYEHHPPLIASKPYKVILFDGKTYFDVVYFRARAPYLLKLFPIGKERIILGQCEKYRHIWTIAHPDHVFIPNTPHTQDLPMRTVIYPLTTGITQTCVKRVIDAAQKHLVPLPEWICPHILENKQWPSWHEAIRIAHQPHTSRDLTLENLARQRLAFDELLAHQYTLQEARRHTHTSKMEHTIQGPSPLARAILKDFPHPLTHDQTKVLQEISRDMASTHQPMARLLQGDVGCGKTIVALLSMLKIVDAGMQAAILAPTDILARQHAQFMAPLLEKHHVPHALLTAREKGKHRENLLQELSDGTIKILIGTHAIIQEDITFQSLGLVIVDEQHRFGVEQRLQLMEKGSAPHLLMMTATPIPRSLALTQFGDMDVSIIQEKPPGRHPVETRVLPMQRMPEIVDAVRRSLESQAQIFWVCPLVEESEKIDITAAQERFEILNTHFPGKVGLIHGKMKSVEKDSVMEQFISGNSRILVATTVIEVGVNIPDATIMIIEHAERYGLAQLHQLRGRIGRGKKPGTCLLLYGPQISHVGRQRLEILRKTTDGFFIAEQDLRLRGGGDLVGTRQSGMPHFRFADFTLYPDMCSDLLGLANNEARKISENDRPLPTERQRALRVLLHVFNKSDVIKYTRS